MTLNDVYNLIKGVALSQPNVMSFVDEFDELNREDAIYSAVVCQQNEHRYTDGFITYNFYLGYVDRLTADKSNKIEIHSFGIELLRNIAYAIYNSDEISNMTMGNFIPLTQKFSAECACVYCVLSITVPTDTCVDSYNI